MTFNNQKPPATLTMPQLWQFFSQILSNEKGFYWLAIIYGLAISLFTLAVPISVQMLINTVANTGLTTPLIGLAVTLFVLLLVSGALNALRTHLMEIFGRKFYARLVSEITIRTLYAQNPFFTDSGNSTLFNRYFDIVTVQKNIPHLLIGGFTLVLQALVGFVIVSLYHPVFLGLNLAIIFTLWVVWAVWGKKATLSAIDLSHTKHNVAGWVESLGASNGYYKSRKHIERALVESDNKTADYINSTKRHFKYTFSQTLAFLFIYAAASALLLGLGGLLVIQGELSLGQLVAAELILSAVFYAISHLGTYLSSFYDLAAAVEELSLFFSVTQEVPNGVLEPRKGQHDLVFANVRGTARSEEVMFNIDLKQGQRVLCAAPNTGVQRLFTELLKHHERPKGGIVSFTGTDVLDIEVHELRQLITILDRPTLVTSSIRDFLQASSTDASHITLLEAVHITGLEASIQSLNEGLDTRLSLTGAPLSLVEVLKLKLAAVLLAEPQVLVLNQLFDMLPQEILERTLDAYHQQTGATILYFTNRNGLSGFNKYILMEGQDQTVFIDQEEFLRLRNEKINETHRDDSLTDGIADSLKSSADNAGETS